MKRFIFFLLMLGSWGFSENFDLNYTQYTYCQYKPYLDKYCDGEEPVWKSGSLRVTLTDDSLLFVFLNKKTTYRIELNTIETDYNRDNEEILVLTGRSGGQNYMFVAGPNYFNLLRMHGWGMYFSNKSSERKSLASRDFGTRKYPIHSSSICFYSEDSERYDGRCSYYNYDEPKYFVLKTAYKYKKLYLYVDTLYTINVSEVQDVKNSDSAKVLLYSGKDKDGNFATVAIGADYFNVILDGITKISMMKDRLPDELVQSSAKESMVSGSSVAIAPDIFDYERTCHQGNVQNGTLSRRKRSGERWIRAGWRIFGRYFGSGDHPGKRCEIERLPDFYKGTCARFGYFGIRISAD